MEESKGHRKHDRQFKEEAVKRVTDVKESAVVASPNEIRNEVVNAFIVLTGDHSPSEDLAKEPQAFVKTRTAPYKYSRRIEFVSDLPKTISGKIKKKELKLREFGNRML